jgi:ribonuclease T1
VRRWLAALLIAAFASSALAFSAIGEIRAADLPPEARQTLALIAQGGPFPYRKDGSVFGNREGLLPPRERGHYREYTVRTPGARDRGARRIVAGRGGERYYTDDHYRSFKRIIQ